ncbi:P-type conjugative transfer protein TrbJ [Pseudomonas sp. NPDC089752]|uniref:P-type conjugative transfer protein TrbJ n=1 Tax=Pseudomonas sp. NPDC089752 TaxID=3364472 RepID=UPI00380B6FD5
MKATHLFKPAITFFVSLGFALQANAGIPVIDGASLSQGTISAVENVAQTLKQVEEYATQINQYKTQLDQYENMIKNTVAPAAYIWDEANSTINKLMNAQDMLNYYTTQAGSMDSYLSKFQDVNYYKGSSCFQLSGCSSDDKATIEAQEDQYSAAQKEANIAMYKGIEQQQQNLKSDARRLEQLQSAAASADGQVKAIQYASQIASQQANQLLQIRGLMLAQQNALAAKSAADQDAQARETAAERNMTSGSYKKVPAETW